MNIIESYNFGQMTIAGKTYTKDIIIFPDGSVLSPWWRKNGHVLTIDDLVELVAAGPEIIVCGTGAMGVMRPAAGLYEYLAAHNIEFTATRSSRAVDAYNQLLGKKNVAGCFHLTC